MAVINFEPEQATPAGTPATAIAFEPEQPPVSRDELLSQQASARRTGRLADALLGAANFAEQFTKATADMPTTLVNIPSKLVGNPDLAQPGVPLINLPTANPQQVADAVDVLRGNLSGPSRPPTGAEQIASGLQQAIAQTGSGFTTPEMVTALPAGAAPKLMTAFGAQMAKDLPEQVAQGAEIAGDVEAPLDQRTLAVANPMIAAAMIGSIAKHQNAVPTFTPPIRTQQEAPTSAGVELGFEDPAPANQPLGKGFQTPEGVPVPAPVDFAPESPANEILSQIQANVVKPRPPVVEPAPEQVPASKADIAAVSDQLNQLQDILRGNQGAALMKPQIAGAEKSAEEPNQAAKTWDFFDKIDGATATEKAQFAARLANEPLGSWTSDMGWAARHLKNSQELLSEYPTVWRVLYDRITNEDRARQGGTPFVTQAHDLPDELKQVAMGQPVKSFQNLLPKPESIKPSAQIQPPAEVPAPTTPAASAEIAAKVPDYIFVQTPKGVRRVSVSASADADGRASINRIKLIDDATGSYEQFVVPKGPKFGDLDAAGQAGFDLVRQKFNEVEKPVTKNVTQISAPSVKPEHVAEAESIIDAQAKAGQVSPGEALAMKADVRRQAAKTPELNAEAQSSQGAEAAVSESHKNPQQNQAIAAVQPTAGVSVSHKVAEPSTINSKPSTPTFSNGQRVAVTLTKRAGAREHMARIVQMQPDGSAMVRIQGEREYRTLPADQIHLTKTDVARLNKAQEIADLGEQGPQAKADAEEFNRLVMDYGFRDELGWFPAEASAREFETKGQAIEAHGIRKTGLARALQAVGADAGNVDSIAERAAALPKVEALIRRTFGDEANREIDSRRKLRQFSRTDESAITPEQRQQRAAEDQRIVRRVSAANSGHRELRSIRAFSEGNETSKAGGNDSQLRQPHRLETADRRDRAGAPSSNKQVDGGRNLPGKLGAAGEKTIRELERIFRVRIIRVEESNGAPAQFNGFKDRGSNVILIDAHNRMPLITILGHELSHHMELTNPQLYKAMERQILALVQNEAGYLKKMSERGDALNEATFNRELVADFIGDCFTRPDFLQKLAQAEPQIFKRFAKQAVAWLDKLISKAKTLTGYDVDKHISELEQARLVVADALARFGREQVTGFKEESRSQESEVSGESEFSRKRQDDGAGDFFSAPESVDQQKARMADEARAARERDAKAAMQDKAAARLTGADIDTTGDIFAADRTSRVDKAGQGSLFSRKRDDYERNLAAVHNLTGENLIYADKLGGLPVPSVAVTRKDIPFQNYGEISMIGKRDLVDPKNTPVFDADAYSPTAPELQWPRVKSAQAQEFIDGLRQAYSDAGDHRHGEIWDALVGNGYKPNPNKAKDAMRDNGGKLAFLRSIGKDVKIPMKPEDVRYSVSAYPEVVQAVKNHPELGKYIGYDESKTSPAIKELADAISRGIERDYGASADTRELIPIVKKEYIEDDGSVVFGRLDRIIEGARIVLSGKTVVDKSGLRERIESAMKGREDDFNAWLDDQVNPLFEAPKIKAGGKMVPVTLDNMTRAMKGSIRGGEDTMTFGTGKARAASAKRFSSLAQMHAGKNRLVTAAELEKFVKEIQDPALKDYRNEALRFYTVTDWRGKVDTWQGLDAATKVLADYINASKSFNQPELMRGIMERNDFKNPDADTVGMALKAADTLWNTPTEYFEAKPQRAVKLEEFAGAIIPDNANPKTRAVLEKRGIPYREYRAGDENHRNEVTQQFRDELNQGGNETLFSRKTGTPTKDSAETRELEFDGGVMHGPALFSLKAHHGTPHKVDRFTTDKIGTGEGAQVYGWGLYFAENKAVAEDYRKSLGYKEPSRVADKIAGALGRNVSRDSVSAIIDHADSKKAIRAKSRSSELRQFEDEKILRAYQAAAEERDRPKGRTYTVKLRPDADDLLDWDKPFSEQSAKVQAALREFHAENKARVDEEMGGEFGGGTEAEYQSRINPTGSMVYNKLSEKFKVPAKNLPPWVIESEMFRGEAMVGSDQRASEFLRSKGIRGIRYADQGSRAKLQWIAKHPSGGENVFNSKAEAEAFIKRNPELRLIEPKQTSNYVIFDSNDIRITHENGQELTPEQASLQPLFSRKDGDWRGLAQEMMDAQAALKQAIADVGNASNGTDKKPLKAAQAQAAAAYRNLEAQLYASPDYAEHLISRGDEIYKQLKAITQKADFLPTPDGLFGYEQRMADKLTPDEITRARALSDEWFAINQEMDKVRKKVLSAAYTRLFPEPTTPDTGKPALDVADDWLSAKIERTPVETPARDITTAEDTLKDKLAQIPAHLGDAYRATRKLGAQVANWPSTWEGKDVISYTKDAADNKAQILANQASKTVLHELNRAFGVKLDTREPLREMALTMAVEAGDRATLDLMRNTIETSQHARTKWGRDAIKAINYADKHFDRLQPIADLYAKISDAQVAAENASGIKTLHREQGYVFHLHDMDNGWMHVDFDTGGGGVGAASPFKNIRDYATYADAIANGQNPRSMNAVDLMQRRLSLGQKLINYRAWENGLMKVKDPATDMPLAAPVEIRIRADGTEVQNVPQGYTKMMFGGQTFGIHKAYAPVFKALTTESALRNGGWSYLMKGAATAKHGMLLFDTFHLGRLAFWNAMARGGVLPGYGKGMEGLASAAKNAITGHPIKAIGDLLPSHNKGLTLLDSTDADIRRMVETGDLKKSDADALLAQRKTLNLLLNHGLNVGSIGDNIYTDWVQKLPVAGRFNKWLFEQYQRGAMSEVALIEFNRQQAMHPEWTPEQTARATAKAVNIRFGNLNAQSWVKNKSIADLMRVFLLAPQWNESLTRAEIEAVKDAGGMAKGLVKGKLHVGMIGRAVATAFIGQFIANQLINYGTRGTPTWENPEEGFESKISAFVPDAFGGPGFFLNPMTLPMEISHLLIKGYERTGTLAGSIGSALRSRESSVGRFFDTLATGSSRTGETAHGTLDRVLLAAKEAAPLPIAGSSITAAFKQLVTGEKAEQYPGQLQRQAMQTFGIKPDSAPSSEQRIQKLAKEWLRHNTDPKLRQRQEQRDDNAFHGDYMMLDSNLRAGNLTSAKKELARLLLEKKPETIKRRYEQRDDGKFTGSMETDKDFLKTLTKEQRDQYTKAIQDRTRIKNLVFRMLAEAK